MVNILVPLEAINLTTATEAVMEQKGLGERKRASEVFRRWESNSGNPGGQKEATPSPYVAFGGPRVITGSAHGGTEDARSRVKCVQLVETTDLLSASPCAHSCNTEWAPSVSLSEVRLPDRGGRIIPVSE